VSRRAISFVIAMAPTARFHSAPHSDGHTGSPDFGSIALAKWSRGETDRIDPAGLPRSRRDLWRAASPPFAQLLPRILQRESYASITEEGRTDSARRPEGRTRARLANLGWASPSVRPGLNIRQGQVATRFPKSFRVPSDAWPPKIACGVKSGSKPSWQGWASRYRQEPWPSICVCVPLGDPLQVGESS
jgi:hypothetical protein